MSDTITSRQRKLSAAATLAALGILAAAGARPARADVLLSNFEPPLGSGLQGWFNYNGNITSLGLTTNPTGGSTNWMSIEYNNLAAWTTAGPTIQPWANSNFTDASFQSHNFLQFDVIFPSDSWLSNDAALPIGINSTGGGDGLLYTIDTTQKDVSLHVVIDYTTYKTSGGGTGLIDGWMNLLFGHPDEAQWGANPFNPRVYVDNVYLTTTSAPPALPPAPNNGTWDPTKSGNWTDTANWVGGIAANGAGNVANFGAAAAPRTVNVNTAGITLARMVIDSANSYTFTNSLITLQSSIAVPNNNAIVVNAGNHSIAAVSVNQNGGETTTFNVASGASLTVDSLSGGGFSVYAKEGGGVFTTDKIQNVSLFVNGGTVTLKPGNAQANGFIYTLGIYNGSTFNLNNNALRINGLYSNETPGVLDLGTGALNMGIYGGADYFGAINGAGDLTIGALAATDPSAIGVPQTVTLGGDGNYTGTTTVTNGNTVNANHHNALGTGALVMDAGTRVNLTAGYTAAMHKSGLTIAGGTSPTATLDVTNNALVVDYNSAEAEPFDTIKAQITSGYNGGAWNGPGIIRSDGNTNQFAVGYAEASALATVPAIFGTVDSTAVLVRGTRYGDANLDGVVNLDDFNALASNFNTTGKVWSSGNFNYDLAGNVNLDDFNLLAGNFNLSAGPDGVVDPEDWAALAAAVPEPGTAIGALLMTSFALSARRRRR